MQTPTKSLPFTKLVDKKRKEQEEAGSPRYKLRGVARRQTDAVRRQLSFDSCDEIKESPPRKPKGKKKSASPAEKPDMNDSGLFSTPDSCSSASSRPSYGFRQLSPPTTDVSSDESDDSLIALPSTPKAPPIRRTNVMKRALANMEVKASLKKTNKRKHSTTTDEPEPKILADVETPPHLQSLSAENSDDSFSLNIVNEEPMDGRSWYGEPSRIESTPKKPELENTQGSPTWFARLGIEDDGGPEIDISDASSISDSEEAAMCL